MRAAPLALAFVLGLVALPLACSTSADAPAAAGGAAAPPEGTSGATSGAGSACVPGSIDVCYAGPAGTDGVGTCIGGVETCVADGSGYGACIDDVVPAVDFCGTIADEDCDGSALGCVPSPTWTRGYHAKEAAPLLIGVDPQGSVIVVGMMMGTIDFGGGPMTPALEQQDLFVLKLDRDGNHVWSKHFGGSGLWPHGLAMDGGGNVLITGVFWGSVDLGAGEMSTANKFDINDFDVFVVKLDPSGATWWSKRFGGDEGDGTPGLAAGADGSVVVLAGFAGTIDFGGGPLGDGASTRCLAKLDPGGNHVWSKDLGSAFSFFGNVGGVGVDAAGDVVVGIGAGAPIDFGSGPVAAGPDGDVIVAKLGPDGEQLWAHRFGDGASQGVGGVAVDSEGGVVLVGKFQGNIDFGGGPLSASGPPADYVARLGPSGAFAWSKDLSTDVIGSVVAAEVSGSTVLGATLVGTVDLGSGPLTVSGTANVLLARIAATGAPTEVKQLGGFEAASFSAMAVDAGGSVVLTGSFGGSVDFGNGPLVATPNESNMFVARLNL